MFIKYENHVLFFLCQVMIQNKASECGDKHLHEDKDTHTKNKYS